MKLTDFDMEISEMKKELMKLLNCDVYVIREITKQHRVPGVYLIRRPDNSEIVYVGTTKNISQRMQGHIKIPKERDLNKMLEVHENYPPEVEKFAEQNGTNWEGCYHRSRVIFFY